MKRYRIVNYRRFAAAVLIAVLIISAAVSAAVYAICIPAGNVPCETVSQETCKEIPLPEEPEDLELPVYYDVPFDHDMQDLVRQAADEAGIDMALALAVIWKESGFRNIMGDGGASYGYMQIQKKWHKDRMDRLGVTDLMDPLSNFRVGCDLLAAHLSWCELEDALTLYNSGHTGSSKYANKVISYMDELTEEVY